MTLLDPQTPERLDIQDQGRAYLFKVPTTVERVKWRRAISAAGGARHSQLALLKAMSDGVNLLMADDVPEIRQAVLDKIEAHRANVTALATEAANGAFENVEDEAVRASLVAGIDKMDATGKALAEIELAIGDAFPRYRSMIADNTVYSEIAGIEGARMFLKDWEGLDGKPVRDAGGLKESSLAKIPEGDFPAIAVKLEELTRVSDAKRKNSVSSPPSSCGDKTSST